jgi:hypothetical protein
VMRRSGHSPVRTYFCSSSAVQPRGPAVPLIGIVGSRRSLSEGHGGDETRTDEGNVSNTAGRSAPAKPSHQPAARSVSGTTFDGSASAPVTIAAQVFSAATRSGQRADRW